MATTGAGSAPGPASGMPELPDDAEIWLVRHGETEWSAAGKHTSITDLPLTDAGVRQAEALAPMIADLRPSLVLSSPRKRAVETAELAGLKVDGRTEDLAEWNYGRYEGRTSHEIREERPGWSLWTDGPLDGETAAEVGSRADRVLERANEALPDGPVVLVGHGHFSRVLGARWIGLPVSGGERLLLGTAAPSILGAQYGAAAIVRWNIPNPAV
jgi:broad specificity phosphatase PhoE